jgi:hypothetical protein
VAVKGRKVTLPFSAGAAASADVVVPMAISATTIRQVGILLIEAFVFIFAWFVDDSLSRVPS